MKTQYSKLDRFLAVFCPTLWAPGPHAKAQTPGQLGIQTYAGLWLISLLCLSGRCVGQTFFVYSVSGSNITITGYNGPGGAVTIPSSMPGVNGTVTSIGNSAFIYFRGLTEVTIPSSVTSIGAYAFQMCSGLTNVTIPTGVTSIGAYAFQGCSALTDIRIPSSVTSIGTGAFYQCSALTAFTVDTQNPSYSSPGGVLLDKNQATLIQYPPGVAGTYTIPSSVSAVGTSAFAYCIFLTRVTIPSSVTTIGDNAFGVCSGLTNVTVGNGVTSIGAYAFQGCNGLTSLIIPSTVTSIGDNAFEGCSSLTSVTIPGSVASIGTYAFGACSGLTNVTIGNGVTSIGDYAFDGCSHLTSVTVPGSVTFIATYAFSNCSGLTSAYFQGDAPILGWNAFESVAPQFSIYYASTGSGWSTPTWNGYPAKPYNYIPPSQRPVLSLSSLSRFVTLSFSDLQPGTNYQLQVSADLKTWSNPGASFTATNTSEVYPESFAATNSNQLFFRLQSSP